jgi:hypothetical protein
MSATWGAGWGTEWDGGQYPPPAGECGGDALNRALRELVRLIMGMPAGSVRPAHQNSPRGLAGENYATVLVADVVPSAQPESLIVQVDGVDTEAVVIPQEAMVSVQFYKVKADATAAGQRALDGAGIPQWSTFAFDQAMRLGARLGLTSSWEMRRGMTLGLSRVGTARNLATVNDAVWESRGQIDLWFNVMALETETTTTFGEIGEINIKVESPDGTVHTKTIEVSP